jgi:hypothetical protein
MTARWLSFFALMGVNLSMGCYQTGGEEAERGLHSPAFVERADEISREYLKWGRVDDEMRFAIAQCSFGFPTNRNAPAMHPSISEDSITHGHKLFLLFAKHSIRGTYTGQLPDSNGVGQAVVKESWISELVDDPGDPLPSVSRTLPLTESGASGTTADTYDDRYIPFARQNGRLYHAARPGGLFVMFKLDPHTPGTDEGWVYATVTADSKQVPAAGRIESCMSCHHDAPHDHLFGLTEK